MAGGEALRCPLVIVRWAAPADPVPDPVVECADPRACQMLLGGLNEAGVPGDLPKFPALTVEVNARPQGVARCDHVLQGVVAHQVETEAVNPVLGGLQDQHVDHQFFRQRVFGRNVRTAGGGG